MEVAVTTDVGTAQRNNEDSWCAEQLHRNVTLLAVADGFGRPQGSTASAHILDAVRDVVRRELKHAIPPRSLTATDVRQLLIRAFCHASERLLRLSGGSADYVAAASTCTAILIVSNEAFIAHVGDSRAYLLRRGELVQLSSDEAFLPDLVASRSGMPRLFRQKGARPLLTRALGLEAEGTAPKVTHHTLHPHDALLFCTDGAYRTLSLNDLQSTIAVRDQRAEWATDKIVALARSCGSADNATVMLVREATEHGASPEPHDDPVHRTHHSLTVGLAAIVAAATVAMSVMWTVDTKLYLSSDASGQVTLYSGSPLSVLGIPLHVARSTYGVSSALLPVGIRQELNEGMAVTSPAAAAALVSQWQPKTQR